MPNFIGKETYLIFGIKSFWNEGLIHVLMSNVLLGRNFDFFDGYCSLLVVTVRYPSLQPVSTFSMNELNVLSYEILQCWLNN